MANNNSTQDFIDEVKGCLTGGGGSGTPGADGYSPTINVGDIDGGHQLTITDVNGVKTVDVLDGEDVTAFVINGTVPSSTDGATATLDKTFAEVQTAYETGKLCVVRLLSESNTNDTYTLVLSRVKHNGIGGKIHWFRFTFTDPINNIQYLLELTSSDVATLSYLSGSEGMITATVSGSADEGWAVTTDKTYSNVGSWLMNGNYAILMVLIGYSSTSRLFLKPDRLDVVDDVAGYVFSYHTADEHIEVRLVSDGTATITIS